MLSGGDANRLGDDVGGHGAQPIEVRLDRPGCERDREVTVESGVGRSQRTSEPVVCALRDEMTRGLVEEGVGDDDDEGRVGADLAEGRVDGESRRTRRARSSPRRWCRRRRARHRPRSPRRTRPRGHRRSAPRPLRSRPPPRAHGRATSPRSRPARRRPARSRSSRGRRRRPRTRRRIRGRRLPARRDRTRTQSERSAPDLPRSETPAPVRRAGASPRRPTPSPKAEPPASTTASTRATVRPGSSSASSRVAGAPPRTSPDADRAVGREHHRDAGARPRPVADPQARDRDREHARQRAEPRVDVSEIGALPRSPTSRAKPMIRRSSSSACSSINMCPPPGNTSSRAFGINFAIRRVCAGGVRWSLVPTITNAGMRTSGDRR